MPSQKASHYTTLILTSYKQISPSPSKGCSLHHFDEYNTINHPKNQAHKLYTEKSDSKISSFSQVPGRGSHRMVLVEGLTSSIIKMCGSRAVLKSPSCHWRLLCHSRPPTIKHFSGALFFLRQASRKSC